MEELPGFVMAQVKPSINPRESVTSGCPNALFCTWMIRPLPNPLLPAVFSSSCRSDSSALPPSPPHRTAPHRTAPHTSPHRADHSR
ncbi:hypothetical protein BC567DRAFT_48473 [Phyllosticta citribraziliensis]